MAERLQQWRLAHTRDLYRLRRHALGAIGANALTVSTATHLNDVLVTNGCATCSDLGGPLRQATFAFKAAALSDPAIQNQVNLNMSTPLAMTGFGPGTWEALGLVLGPLASYKLGGGAPCTDEDGNCLGFNQSTPMIPAATGTLMQQVVDMIAQLQKIPATLPSMRDDLARGIQQLVGQALTALAAANIVMGGGGGGAITPPAPPAPAVTTAKPFPTGTVLIGGLIGVAVVAGAVMIGRKMR